MGETLLFHSDYDDPSGWIAALKAELPDVEVRLSSDPGDPARVRYALVWAPPRGFFRPFVNLSLVINLGAGVDALVALDDLPDVPLTRISDPEMARMMASFVLMAVLRHARDIPALEQAQREKRWTWISPRPADEVKVGVLGLGELGARAAREIAGQGFAVRGWSRTRKELPGIDCRHGAEALDPFLDGLDILVAMLPSTPQTRGLLDARRLALLPKGAAFVNVARGDIVDEEALIAALRSGQIGAATLDVFAKEPLPQDSPLWTLPNVLVTPHLASIAIPKSGAAQIAQNIRRIREGLPPLHQVDPRRGY